MFRSIKHSVPLDCVVLRADSKGSFPPDGSCCLDPFDSHFPLSTASRPREGQPPTQQSRLQWAHGKEDFFPGDWFLLQGSVVEKTLDLGLVPGFITFQLWPLGMSQNYFLSLSLLGLLRCKRDVIGPNLRLLWQ